MAYDLNCVCFTPIPQTIHQKKSWTQHGPALFPQLLLARMRLPRCQPWMWSVPLKLARWNPSLVPRNNGLSRMYGKQTMLRGIVTGCLSVWAYPFHSQSRKIVHETENWSNCITLCSYDWLLCLLLEEGTISTLWWDWKGHRLSFENLLGSVSLPPSWTTQFMRNMQMSWTKLFLTAFMEMKVKGQSVLPSWIFRLKHPWDWICLMKALPARARKRFQRMHAFWFQLVRFVMTWIPAMSAAHGAWTTMRVGTATWNATCFLAFRMPGTKKANITFCTNTWSLWLRRQQVFFENGIMVDNQVYFGAFVGLKGDLKFHKEVTVGLTRCYANLGKKNLLKMCSFCWAGSANFPFEEVSECPAWTSTMYRDRPWTSDPFVAKIPFDSCAPRVLTKTRPLSHHEGRIQQGTLWEA